VIRLPDGVVPWHAPTAVADALIATRLDSPMRQTYGSHDVPLDTDALLARVLP
jgi:hypothetical protein